MWAHKPLEEILSLVEQVKWKLPIGSIWSHYKNSSKQYVIVDIVVYEADDELLVIYESKSTLGQWLRFARKVAIFMESVSRQWMSVPRFTKMT